MKEKYSSAYSPFFAFRKRNVKTTRVPLAKENVASIFWLFFYFIKISNLRSNS